MNDTFNQTDDTTQEQTSQAEMEEITDVTDTGEGSKGGRAAEEMEVEVNLENAPADNEEQELGVDTVL